MDVPQTSSNLAIAFCSLGKIALPIANSTFAIFASSPSFLHTLTTLNGLHSLLKLLNDSRRSGDCSCDPTLVRPKLFKLVSEKLRLDILSAPVQQQQV